MKTKYNIDFIKYFSELGMFDVFNRTGGKLSKVPFEEKLSSHIVKAAQIAYILAHLEGADPEKTATIVLFHDNGELRVGDQHKVASRYYDNDEPEKKAFNEQSKLLPTNISKKIIAFFQEYNLRNTKEGIIARDADWLEQAIYAKEMVEKGYIGFNEWIKNVRKALETKAAKDILDQIIETNDFSNLWWQNLKKMTYEKLK